MWRNVEKQELGALRKVADWWDLKVVWHLGGFQSGPILKCLTRLNLDLETWLVGFSHQHWWLLSSFNGSLIDIPIQPHFGWPFSRITALVSKFWGKFIGSMSTFSHQPEGFLRLKSPFSHELRKNRWTHRVKHKNLPKTFQIDQWNQWMDGFYPSINPLLPRYEDLLFPTRVAARTAQVLDISWAWSMPKYWDF